MKGLIINDFKRVLKGYRFWAVISVILISTVINLLTTFTYDHTKSIGAINLFLYGNARGNPIMALTAPFLASFIFSTAVNDDIKTGLFSSYISKISVRKYFVGRAVSTALTAACAFLFAFILILLGCYMYDPSYAGDIFNPVGVFSEIYGYSVGLYVILFVLHSSMFASIYALLGMGMATITRNNFIPLAFPGIIYHCAIYITAILNKTALIFVTAAFPSLSYETASMGMSSPENMLKLGTMLCVAIVLIIIGYRRMKNMNSAETAPLNTEVSNGMLED